MNFNSFYIKKGLNLDFWFNPDKGNIKNRAFILL